MLRSFLSRASTPVLLALMAWPLVSQAARPGGNSQLASGSPPEIYRISVDYSARILAVHGTQLITGSTGSPEYPLATTLGGAGVAIDQALSRDGTDFTTNRGALFIPFDSILAAHANLVVNGAIPAGRTFALRVKTSSGTASSSFYLAQPVVAVSAPPPPPSTGSCPCSNLYDQYYNALYALLWPTCTAPGSSNATAIVPTGQYIEASYIDELWIRTVTISSDSSISPRNSGSSNHVGSCSVRTDGGAYMAGPIPVSDEDHSNCVADIIAREPICRGGGWLDP